MKWIKFAERKPDADRVFARIGEYKTILVVAGFPDEWWCSTPDGIINEDEEDFVNLEWLEETEEGE